jgi:hypothetical protein
MWLNLAKIFLDAEAGNLVQKRWLRFMDFQPFKQFFVPPAGFSKQLRLIK